MRIDEAVEKNVELARLLDCYGAMLTHKQRSFLDQHLNEDCSLFEIAEREGISRQGVRDAIKRGEETLLSLESTLHVAERTDRLMAGLNEMKNDCGDDPAMTEKINKLIEICEDTYGV